MDKINLGIVGLGFGRHVIEKQILQGPAHAHFRLAAVCQRNRVKADEAAARYGTKVYYSVDDLLADPDIRAVGLFTGPAGRAEQIRKIITAGRDVMTTKPLERSAAAALAVLTEAQRLGRTVHLNSPVPVLTADLRQIADWRRQYDLGRAVSAQVAASCRYAEKADGSWYDDPDCCPAAPIFRLGIYAINDLVPFFGQGESVQVAHSRLLTGRPTPDNALLSIRFAGGALAAVSASFCVQDGQAYRQTMLLSFENGTIRRRSTVADDDTDDVELTLFRPSGRARNLALTETAAHPIEKCSGRYQWDIFYRALRGESFPDRATPDEMVAGLRIVEAMARAEKSGRTEPVQC
ncbi:MAG: Gfo/Idh/MocA family oxidoreductase [Thermoguttaceae bacterium]